MNKKINTIVVRALMALRLIDEATLSHTLQIPLAKLNAWLYEDDVEAVSFHRQMEILSMLGINEGNPRDDVVHHWTVVEPIFGQAQSIYWAVEVMLRAFGRAQAVYVAPETDPALSFKAISRYGLRFDRFYALLEVHGNPLCNIRFRPEALPGLTWMPGNYGLLLEAERMPELLPGAMAVEQFAEDVSVPQELLKWERLSKLATSSKIRPEELAKWIVSNNPQLSFESSQVDETESAQAPGEEEDQLFTAALDEPEDTDGASPSAAVDEAVHGVADVDGEASVGPTGLPPRRQSSTLRSQYRMRR